jgi:hypothetical protein
VHTEGLSQTLCRMEETKHKSTCHRIHLNDFQERLVSDAKCQSGGYLCGRLMTQGHGTFTDAGLFGVVAQLHIYIRSRPDVILSWNYSVCLHRDSVYTRPINAFLQMNQLVCQRDELVSAETTSSPKPMVREKRGICRLAPATDKTYLVLCWGVCCCTLALLTFRRNRDRVHLGMVFLPLL